MTVRPKWRRWQVLKLKVWEAAMTIAAVAAFAYQVSLNYELFLEQPIMLMVSLDPNPAFRLPPMTMCPDPVYDIRRLTKLGLNTSAKDSHQLHSLVYFGLRGIKDHVTPARLWKEAGREFDQVISKTTIDMQSPKPTTSFWRRSYSPIGPCFTFHAPKGITAASIKWHAGKKLEQCKFVNDDGELVEYSGLPSSCTQVETQCNSSCAVESYIQLGLERIKGMYVYFHQTSVAPPDDQSDEEDIWRYSQQLFDGNYFLKNSERAESVLVQSHLVETSQVKGPCSSDFFYDPGECFRQQYSEKLVDKLNCCPAYQSILKNSRQYICQTPADFSRVTETEFESQFSCPRRCHRTRWNQRLSYFSGGLKLHLRQEAVTTHIKRETELETYPTSRLFSDTGGSLGLFLGISILTFWELLLAGATYCRKLRPTVAGESKNRFCMLPLAKYSGILLLAIATCTHILVTLQSYVSQPRLTSVFLRDADDAKISVSEHPKTLVAQRLAMQALECLPDETISEECLTTCLLKKAMEELDTVAPFVRNEGLPNCKDIEFSVPSFAYVVPPEMLFAATTEEKVDKCRIFCHHIPKGRNSSQQPHSLRMVVNNAHYSLDALQLVCSIGGITGLYLGYSIFTGLDLIRSLLNAKNSLKSFGLRQDRTQTILKAAKVGVCFIGVGLAFLQLHTFLFYHKISASTKKEPMTNKNKLALTICRWPHLSLEHVEQQLELNITERLLQLPPEERLQEYIKILDTLPGNWSGSPDDLWKTAAWNVSDVISTFFAFTNNNKRKYGSCTSSRYSDNCQRLWKPVITRLNRCFSLTDESDEFHITKATVSFSYRRGETVLRGHHLYYVALHRTDELPILDNMVPSVSSDRLRMAVKSVAYKPLYGQQQMGDDSQETISYSFCIHKCLSEGGTRHLNCRLPYMTWQSDVTPCNREQYRTIPSILKGLQGIGKDWYMLKQKKLVSPTLISLRDNCYRECHRLQQTFDSMIVKKSDVSSTHVSLVVNMEQAEEGVVLEEDDQHSLSQLLSDMGGIAGSTAGCSLLYVLKDLLPQLMTRYRNHLRRRN